jgi:hypothetical protein
MDTYVPELLVLFSVFRFAFRSFFPPPEKEEERKNYFSIDIGSIRSRTSGDLRNTAVFVVCRIYGLFLLIMMGNGNRFVISILLFLALALGSIANPEKRGKNFNWVHLNIFG